MRRLVLSLSFMAFVLGFIATPPASAQQSVNLFVGGFTPRSLDARPNDDVLVNNLDFLDFRIKDFNGATFGGEWLVALGNNIEAGLGVGLYTRTVPTVYSGDLVNDQDGSAIEQDLKLRIIPFTATVRFLPLGRHAAIQPYIGAGVGVMRFRYSETGEFVDFSDNNNIFRGNFIGSGTATGPVILAGARFPAGAFDIGGEIRYQSAKGDLPPDQTFSGSKIDLGGFNYLLTINIRF
jgi:outer membrane protein W